jgi:hypothetical protein
MSTLIDQRQHYSSNVSSLEVDFEFLEIPDGFARLRDLIQAGQVDEGEFYSVVEWIFGFELVNWVRDWNLFKSQRGQLEQSQCLEILACIAHSVTIDDLKALQEKVNSMEAGHPLKQFLGGDLHKLISLMRNPLLLLNPYTKKTLSQQIASHPGKCKEEYMAYTVYQSVIEKLAANANPESAEFIFAPHEHLAKFVGYVEPRTVRDGMIIPIYQKGALVYYKLESHLVEDGLCAYFFTPIDEDSQYPAQMVFRGTVGPDSIARDLDLNGVGFRVFQKHFPSLFERVEGYGARVKNFELEVCGHSLGAADAQRMVAGLVSRQREIPFLRKLRSFAYCSPKLDMPTVKQWEKDIPCLADLDNPLHVHLHFAQHEDDLVTKAGDFNLPSANTSFCHASYLSVTSKPCVLGVARHHQIPFFEAGVFDDVTDGRQFKIYEDVPLQDALDRLGDFAEKQLMQSSGDWDVMLRSCEVLTDEERVERQKDEELLKRLEKDKIAIEATQKGAAQHSWLVWGASNAMQPLKLVLSLIASLF